MLARVSIVSLVLVMVTQIFAAPVAHPDNFETDPMLQVGVETESSYAKSEYKRANFETDPMLQVGQKEDSSYAETY
ncbi:hypothetical protein F5B19DRAFT_70448 [Rostrohypoxylon terebratum]|nr:hypothetical protein F5B19DRAFT_70448 [Rostrohypoxylon terebratum]